MGYFGRDLLCWLGVILDARDKLSSTLSSLLLVFSSEVVRVSDLSINLTERLLTSFAGALVSRFILCLFFLTANEA